ncbi:hypothetical protein [Streptomyces sp. 891-h]|uniref:hypothetical protein n=1 Tax=Streptomyces sp. 891-h TaxID=2720714 RepID=UPI001FA9BC02|nr:hypothetical protein [Streptomyces sp. 891-h]UNZ20357.1 hypothetical protein HC362_28170 [Streptomyces sp. 891-h]
MRVAADDDEIHWRRELPASNTAATWRARQKLSTAARAMLRAAALAAQRSTGFHGARGERLADAFADRVRYAESAEEGSAGRQLSARVPPEAQHGDRELAVLSRALRATADAVCRYRATGATEHFDAAVADGCCAELTESLCQMVRGTEGVRITLGWSRTAGTPQGCPQRPLPVVFTPGDLAALELAGRHYERAEPSVPVRLTGTVVRLRRARPDGPGSVRLDVLAGAEVTQVRARLEEEGYRRAVHAHLAGLPLRIAGLLESRGGFRRLSGCHDIAPAPVPDQARERLLKRLHNGLDDFERGMHR